MLPHYVSQLSYHTEDVKNKFDWDQAPFPKKGNNPVRVMFWYSAWTMNAHGKHLDESFQLLQFISGPIGSRPGVELGWELPLFTSLDPSYNKTIIALGKNVKPAIDGFQHRITRHYYHQPRWDEAWTKFISPALDQIFTGKKTANAALNEITPQVNNLLQEGAKLMGTA
jgi:ABC-type glycerol-3-phosphate transport system substrate-binding protein